MSAATLLERLEHVHQCTADRWRAICPAHPSKRKTRTLSIRELPDGRVLIRCHAECGGADVLAAVGLTFADLFPRDHTAPQDPCHAQRPNHWHAARDAMQTVTHESLLVAIAADDIAAGVQLAPADAKRVALAAVRIRAAVEACR